MSVRSHIVFTLVASIIAWASWLLVLVNVDPRQAQWWGFALFYATLFLSLFGSLAVLGFTFRSIIQFKRATTNFRLTTSLRQSFLWSLALVIALGLQGARILSWWIFLLIIIIFILVEIIISSTHYYSDQRQQ